MRPLIQIPRAYPPWDYDTALPALWVDRMIRAGFDPRGLVVWAYPPGDLFGCPWPLCPKAAYKILSRSRNAASIAANWQTERNRCKERTCFPNSPA